MKLQRAFSLVTLALLLPLQLAAQTVHIPDEGLKHTLRARLNKPTGDITVQDLESLHYLHGIVGAPVIGSVEGLQHAINLTNLFLSGVGGHFIAGIHYHDRVDRWQRLRGKTVQSMNCNPSTKL